MLPKTIYINRPDGFSVVAEEDHTFTVRDDRDEIFARCAEEDRARQIADALAAASRFRVLEGLR